MKKFKLGFTLAEVLITLTVIGILTAMVVPTTMSNYQVKALGTQIAKFAANLENASLSYIASNGDFENIDAHAVRDFVNEYFILTKHIFANTAEETPVIRDSGHINTVYGPIEINSSFFYPTSGADIAVLKDGTAISQPSYFKERQEYENHNDVVITSKYGYPAFCFGFMPSINGLPSDKQKYFNFVVTDKGYVFPHDKDECLWSLFGSNYATNTKNYTENLSCTSDKIGLTRSLGYYLKNAEEKEEK